MTTATPQTNMKKVSFLDLYKYECDKPTPRQAFIAECARVADVSEATVKQWANCIQQPNKYALKLLAEHFNCDPDYLFPKESEK